LAEQVVTDVYSIITYTYILSLEYCGTRAVPNVETSEYLTTLGNKLNPKINIMWTGKLHFMLLFVLCLLFWFIILWILVLLSTCAVSFSSDGEGHSWFFYAWLKVQLHLSFFFPTSRPATLSKSSKLQIFMVSCVIFITSIPFSSLKFFWYQYWILSEEFWTRWHQNDIHEVHKLVAKKNKLKVNKINKLTNSEIFFP